MCLQSLPKQRDLLWRNLAWRRMSSVCRTTVGSFVDRSHRCEENQHFIQVFECKQTCRKQTRSAIFRTLCRVAPTVLTYSVTMGAGKIQDRVRSAICIQLDGVRSVVGMGYSAARYALFRLVRNNWKAPCIKELIMVSYFLPHCCFQILDAINIYCN